MKGEKTGGRAKGSRNKLTEATLALISGEESPLALLVKVSRDTEQELPIRLNAARWSAPYLHPRPQPRLVEFELPESINSGADLKAVHASLLRATAKGELALEDARELSGMLETQRKLVETVELEARIARLEAERKP